MPWSIISSTCEAGLGTDGWNLAAPGENPEAVRDFTVQIAFVSPFSLAPVIHLGLTGFDADQRDSTRISLKTGRVTEFGFEAIISTWSSTRIYGVAFNWLAIGA